MIPRLSAFNMIYGAAQLSRILLADLLTVLRVQSLNGTRVYATLFGIG